MLIMKHSHPSRFWLDCCGATGSILCAVHCAVLPIFLAVLPLAQSRAHEWVEKGIFVLACGLALSSLVPSARRHHRLTAIMVAVLGFSCLTAGVWFDVGQGSALLHAAIMTAGGLLISTAHLLNLRYCSQAAALHRRLGAAS